MNTDEFSNKYREGNVYIISGPIEHWVTTLNTQYWGFTNSNSDKMAQFKKGDIFLFHASHPEYLDKHFFLPSYSDYKILSGIIGLGVYDRSGYKQTNSWLGEFARFERAGTVVGGRVMKNNRRRQGQPNHWPHLLIFSLTYWFGKVNLIDDVGVDWKSQDEIFRDIQKLSLNDITFEEMRNAGYTIPAQGTVAKLNDINKSKLLPLILNRLALSKSNALKVNTKETAGQGVSPLIADRQLTTIGKKDITLQTKTKGIKPEYVSDFRLKPFLIKNNIKTKSKNKLYIDFDERHEKNSNTGNKGEEMVLKNEKEFLNKLGRMDLANRVKRISLEDTSAGYDILSFDSEGGEKLIEVKATVLPKRKGFSFNMSSNEIKFAEKSSNYYIYLVFDVDGQSPKIATIKDPFSLGLLLMEPTQYRIRGNTE